MHLVANLINSGQCIGSYYFKDPSSLPRSPATTAKVRRPLIVAGEYLVGVHPSAHLAVEGTPVVLSLVLWEVAFGYCYNMRHSRHFGFRISQRKAVKRPVMIDEAVKTGGRATQRHAEECVTAGQAYKRAKVSIYGATNSIASVVVVETPPVGPMPADNCIRPKGVPERTRTM